MRKHTANGGVKGRRERALKRLEVDLRVTTEAFDRLLKQNPDRVFSKLSETTQSKITSSLNQIADRIDRMKKESETLKTRI